MYRIVDSTEGNPGVVEDRLYLVSVWTAEDEFSMLLLELLVAFIQAYVFAFLATIFIAMGLHEH